MSRKFQKKNFAELKKQENDILDRDLETFQGSAMELFFIKLGRRIQRNRLGFFGGAFAIFLLIGGILGYLEYADYRAIKSTEKLEIILETWEKGGSPSTAEKIQELEKFLGSEASGDVVIRVAKTLSDLYAEAKEYKKAAELLENAGKKIDGIRESKAFYFYLAGNYRELAEDKDLSLKNYQTAASLLDNLREAPSFRAWSLYHSGRLLAEKGDKNGAGEALRKILLIEPGEAMSDLEEVKRLSTFLLLKISQKS